MSVARSLANSLQSLNARRCVIRSASTIPDIYDHAVGRQREELDDEKAGIVTFNRDPIETDETQGNSKEDPILVPSFNEVRPIGVSHNDSSYVFWFNLQKGKTFYVPAIEKYFKLYHPQELAESMKKEEIAKSQA
uniref:Uncharacterized protein AlNc14C245G9537 n=1 Tax=Albugo laibachii Nc14 TaxID=890382 RepID=F0WT53_9STRA|nr:conserved hypothetical protein [Albugo laibachii Nc14]CCA25971.1 conserved hypothetical protein [Albugo laibachii Nc14]|eukprot:CCA25971.1 conserved hypothetical protein [Albugo laibachii Nc14]